VSIVQLPARTASRTGIYFWILCFALVFASVASAGVRDSSTTGYQKPYKFTSDWFTEWIPNWKKVLAPFAGKPNVRYLEVGLFQGRSALWVLENILTHPSSKLTGIDIKINEYLVENIDLAGATKRVTLLEGSSQELLKTIPSRSFDIIYVDGSHKGDDVLMDAVLSFAALKDGGVLIFDDYVWETGTLPSELRPMLAINAFLILSRSQVTILSKHHQLIVKKRHSPCDDLDRRFCSHLGSYVYEWKKQVLRDSDGRKVPLTDTERLAAELLMKQVKMGKTRIAEPTNPDPAYESLKKKLGREKMFPGVGPDS